MFTRHWALCLNSFQNKKQKNNLHSAAAKLDVVQSLYKYTVLLTDVGSALGFVLNIIFCHASREIRDQGEVCSGGEEGVHSLPGSVVTLHVLQLFAPLSVFFPFHVRHRQIFGSARTTWTSSAPLRAWEDATQRTWMHCQSWWCLLREKPRLLK